MFYRHNKTFWYQFWIFQHVLLAENSEDGWASSCVEFSIGLSCNPVWDWVLLELEFSIGLSLVPMVTALLLSTVPGHHIGPPCIRTNQKFRHKFSVFECIKTRHKNCSKLCTSILTFGSHYPVLQNVIFLLEGPFH